MRTDDLDPLFDRFRRNGDLDALGELFDRAAPRLRRVAAHFAREPELVDDLVQATFLAAIEGARRYRPRKNVEGWLVGILSNQARKVAAQRARRIDPDRLTDSPPSDPSSHAVATEVRQAVVHALPRVPAPYAEVLRSLLLDGRSPSEIASSLGRERGTVHVQIHRGMKLLRRALPPGIAGGLALFVPAPRGLAGVKELVLAEAEAVFAEAASTSAVAVALTSSGAAKVGGVLVGAALLALLVKGWDGTGAAAEEGALRPDAGPTVLADTRDDSLAEGRPNEGRTDATPDRAPLVPHTPGEPVARPVALTGRVIDLLDRSPVPGARVEFFRLEGDEWVAAGSARRTDREGLFAIDSAASPFYRIDVTAEGYLGHTNQLGIKQTSWAFMQGDPRGIVFEVVLAPPLTVRGRVVKADGSPLDGPADLYTLNNGHFRHVGASEADGRFSIDRLSLHNPNRVQIVAFRGGLFALSDQARVSLGEREVDGIVVTLPEQTGALRVSVVDPSGEPVAGAKVVVTPSGGVRYHGHQPMILGPTLPRELRDWFGDRGPAFAALMKVTDDDGEAAFPGLPINGPWHAYDVRCTPPPDSGLKVGTEGGEGITAGEEKNLELRLASDRTIAVRGVVVDPAGGAVAGARIDARGPVTVSGDDGRFEIAVPPNDEVDLDVWADGYAYEEFEIELDPEDDERERVRLVLDPARPITGRVVDQYGVPVEGVELVARRENGPRILPRARLTGPEGEFAFPYASAGHWQVEANTPQPADEWGDVDRFWVPGGATDAELVLYRLPPPVGRLVARLRQQGTGEAFTASDFDLRRVAGTGDPMSEDEDPQVVASPGLIAATRLHRGEWMLRVEQEIDGVERKLPAVVFEITEDEPTVALDIESTPFGSGTLAVEIVVEEGRPRGDFDLQWYPDARMRPIDWVGFGGDYDEDERVYTSKRLPEGHARLLYRTDGFSGVVESPVVAGQETRVELLVRPSAKLVFVGERDVPGHRLHLEYQPPEDPRDEDEQIEAPESGTWFVVDVHPGTYDWRVHFDHPSGSAPRYESQSDTVAVTEGELLEIVVPVVEEPRDD